MDEIDGYLVDNLVAPSNSSYKLGDWRSLSKHCKELEKTGGDLPHRVNHTQSKSPQNLQVELRVAELLKVQNRA